MLALMSLVNWLSAVLHACINLVLYLINLFPFRLLFGTAASSRQQQQQQQQQRGQGRKATTVTSSVGAKHYTKFYAKPEATASSTVAAAAARLFTSSALWSLVTSSTPSKRAAGSQRLAQPKESIKKIISRRSLKVRPTSLQKLRTFAVNFARNVLRLVKFLPSLVYFCAHFASGRFALLRDYLRSFFTPRNLLRVLTSLFVKVPQILFVCFRHLCCAIFGGFGTSTNLGDFDSAMSHKMIDCNHLRPRFLTLQRDLTQFAAPFYIFPTSPLLTATGTCLQCVVGERVCRPARMSIFG